MAYGAEVELFRPNTQTGNEIWPLLCSDKRSIYRGPIYQGHIDVLIAMSRILLISSPGREASFEDIAYRNEKQLGQVFQMSCHID